MCIICTDAWKRSKIRDAQVQYVSSLDVQPASLWKAEATQLARMSQGYEQFFIHPQPIDAFILCIASLSISFLWEQGCLGATTAFDRHILEVP